MAGWFVRRRPGGGAAGVMGWEPAGYADLAVRGQHQRAARARAVYQDYGAPVFPVGPGIPTPSAFWRLEEASGTRVDSTGNGHDLDVLTNTPGNGTGKLGSALSLASASSQEIHKASEAGLVLSGDGTWACWVKATGFNGTNQGNFAYAMFKGSDFSVSGQAEWDIHFSLTGTPIASVWNGTGQYTATAGSTISTGAWHLVAGKYTSADHKVYVSVDGGAWSAGVAAAGAANTGTHQMTLGRLIGLGSTFFDGLIDAPGFWPVAFSDAQIGALYNGGAGSEYYSGVWH